MGGGGGEFWWKKILGQILCSGAFGANIHCYTEQRARHGSPFLQPPPLLRRPPPPPPEAIFRSPSAMSVAGSAFVDRGGVWGWGGGGGGALAHTTPFQSASPNNAAQHRSQRTAPGQSTNGRFPGTNTARHDLTTSVGRLTPVGSSRRVLCRRLAVDHPNDNAQSQKDKGPDGRPSHSPRRASRACVWRSLVSMPHPRQSG